MTLEVLEGVGRPTKCVGHRCEKEMGYIAKKKKKKKEARNYGHFISRHLVQPPCRLRQLCVRTLIDEYVTACDG